MTERRKDLLILTTLLLLLIAFFGKILFTDKIVRAPDIINEFYWGVKSMSQLNLWESLKINLSSAGWDIYSNSGFTTEGGGHSLQFLLHKRLLFNLLPAPASVAWFMVLHLFFGGVGTYLYCRLIGVSRIAAFFAGFVFALAPENASLINAGHVMKIATISYAPLAFYFLERGFQRRRLFDFMATSFVLAFQFFNYHWQIAFYTCLCIGLYAIIRLVLLLLAREREAGRDVGRLIGLNLVTLVFFLSTVAISLFPLANWSTDTNRGVQSGANQGKGGLNRDEAMSWSMPPEEMAAFVVPGMFGLSRQEGGENPTNIRSYYWGRMVFTQTTSYLGFLPWLLAPLPLLFRRDRYTVLATVAIVGGLLFSMGKYTPFYNFLFDYFPGIDRFRVPKMMMFMVVLGLAVMAARGIDCLLDENVRCHQWFRRYLFATLFVPVVLGGVLAVAKLWEGSWQRLFYDMLAAPTRYEQGTQLVIQRWQNLLIETGVAIMVSATSAAGVWLIARRKLTAASVVGVLLCLFLADVGRVNAKFLFLVDEPQKSKGIKTPVMEFLAKAPKEYRAMPLADDPLQYATAQIPVMFTFYPVQQQRWQDYLDSFSFAGAMPDILNVKYLIYPFDQYQQERAQLGSKYVPVFQSPDGSEVVLENRTVLPKAWLVPSVLTVAQPQHVLGILQNPQFDPRRIAVVEIPPLLTLAPPDSVLPTEVGVVQVKRYDGEQIDLSVTNTANALLVLGEKYYKGWKATVDGKPAEIQRVNYILRGVYLPPGNHQVEFIFDPLPFKIGKYLTLTSFGLFAFMLWREWRTGRGKRLLRS